MNRRERLRQITQIGFPERFPIVQFPNAPLAIALLAGALAENFHGHARHYTLAISYLALTVWAYEELSRGANWLRRLLGLCFLIVSVLRVAHALGG
jgi:hypothetical protein